MLLNTTFAIILPDFTLSAFLANLSASAESLASFANFSISALNLDIFSSSTNLRGSLVPFSMYSTPQNSLASFENLEVGFLSKNSIISPSLGNFKELKNSINYLFSTKMTFFCLRGDF